MAEEVFDLERLRRNWDAMATGVAGVRAQPEPLDGKYSEDIAADSLRKIRAIALARFPDRQDALVPMLDEIEALVCARFPVLKRPDRPSGQGQEAVSLDDIAPAAVFDHELFVELVADLEDLLEAFLLTESVK